MVLHVWLERKQFWWEELGEKWTNKLPNFTWIFTTSFTSSHFVEKLWSWNMLWKLWYRLWTSFYLMYVVIPSFNIFFCHKLILNVWTSCTVKKIWWLSRGTVLKGFFNFETRNRKVREWERQSCICTYDENWLWDVALLCVISHRLCDFNNKFQG
jgi:hypothetical protein